MAAKSNILKNACKGYLGLLDFMLYFLAIWLVTSTPNFVLLKI